MDCQRKIRKPAFEEKFISQKSAKPHASLKIFIFTLVATGFLLGAGWRLAAHSLRHLNSVNRLTAHSKIITGKVLSKRGVLGTFGMDYSILYQYQSELPNAASITKRSSVSRAFFQNANPESWTAVHCDPENPDISMLDLPYNRNRSRYLPGLITGPLLMLAGLAAFSSLLSSKVRTRIKEWLGKNS